MTRFLALFALAFCAEAFGEPIPIETFFKLPQYAEIKISPDGEFLAALAPFKGRQNLVVLDLATRSVQPVTTMESRDVVWFSWVNSKRLVLRTGSLGERAMDARGGGLFSVDRDGKFPRQLSEGRDEGKLGTLRLVAKNLSFVRTLHGKGDDIVVQEVSADARKVTAGALFRLDTRSGKKTLLSLDQPDSADSESWVVDGNGIARVLICFGQRTNRTYYRAGPDAPWIKIAEVARMSPTWFPVAIADDNKTLYVISQKERDKATLYRFDPKINAILETVASHPRVDIGSPVYHEDRVVGVQYNDDKLGVAWFDERLASIQKAVDGALPNTVNRLDWSRKIDKVLIFSSSDVSPGSYHLLNTQTGKIEWLADRSPWIKPEAMSPMRAVRYRARDGLEIPAFLTIPKGSNGKNLPLVVLVHGGPWVDGASWHFDPEAQFLASRGYAVLQPNFRGTTHYGWKHFSASFKQWGLAMQDDVSDGALWAIEQGIADKNRICIYGASYGGYAAMMGLVKTPELFQCGINYVGVTDIATFLTIAWADYAYSDFIRFSAKVMVADIDTDKEQLRATSPVLLVERIRAPVMMAYGSEDRRVPLVHGEKMKAALEKYEKKFVWQVMAGEGHGFRRIENQVAFYGAMETFLAEHIGVKK